MNYVRVGGYIPPQPIEDYNDLPNIPVHNQDLTASGFTPVANTYYKHTGTTTASYTNGVIYYYNSTGYAALDGAAANNGTLTIQKNGTDIATFGANQSTNTTANIIVPTKASDINALPISGGSITGDLTVGGNLTVNGTTTTVDSTTLQVKDKLIEVAHGNTSTLTTPAGLVAPKYDGTNSGALVFDSTGTAYVGDVTLKDGNIDVANSGLQPLATRTGLVGGNLVQYDSSEQTLKDSGKKISDLATTSQVNEKYTKPSGGIPKTDLASDVQTSLGKADTAVQSDALSVYAKKSDLAQVATSGSYNDLTNKPTIPAAANNGTLTIQKNGTNVATFGANQSTNATANITVPVKVSELTNDSGFTTNKGTITGINMNGASKGTSGVVDLGTVLTDASKFATAAQGTKADNAMPKSGDTFTGPVSSKSYYKSENADLRTSTTLSHIAVKVDNGKTNSHTAYMNGQINIKSASSSSEKTITIPDKAGTIALTSDIHDGTLTIQKNGETVGTFTANQSSSVTANITVPTKASDINALSLDGGTINKSKTIKMDASANSDGANLKWGTVNSKNPYIGYASDQVDGTFVIGSLLGTNYASGLAIGGGSGNLLWKGTKVATINDIPNIVQSTGTSTSSVMSQNATTNAISGKLDKTTYEVNKTINFGQNGALYIGKFKVYDTNVSFEITSTTSVTYSGKLVIAAQNYVISEAKVYGDAANTVTPNIYIKPSTTSDPYIEVYFKPESWSKNVVHIYGSNIQAEPTDVCTDVPSVPSTATLKPKNALPVHSLSGTTLTITM